MHLPASTSEEHLSYVRSNLPTVNEDDIFSTVGGLELGLEQEPDVAEQLAHPSSEATRTLLVRNLASDASDEELRNIFQAFGDLRAIYTGAKHRGLLRVSYYDLRAAVSALNTLQGTLVSHKPISLCYAAAKPTSGHDSNVQQGMVVVFNLDPDTTNDHLVWLFSKFGEVKDIHESSARPNQKFITFYDVRHAAAALKAMNRAEQLNKLPSHLTPQQVATLQSHTSGPNLMQLAQLHQQQSGPGGSGDAAGTAQLLQWDPSTSPAAMEGLMHLVKQQQQHPQHSQHSHGSNPMVSSGPGTAHASHHDLQVPAAGPGPSMQHPGPGPQHPHHPAYGKFHHNLDPLVASARALHISDSASSIASVPGSIMVAAAGGAVPKGLPGHMPHMGGASRGGPGGAGMLPMPGMDGGHGHQSAAAMNAAAMLNAAAAADRQAAQQQQLLWQATETANMLMNLGLNNNEGQWSDGQGGLAGGPGGSNGAWGNGGSMYPNAAQLNTLQELQARQQAAAQLQHQAQQQQVQQQAQQLALAQLQAQQALQAQGMNLGTAANLQAAAQILQAAGLNQALGGQGYLPGALNTSAAAQILQHAGLGLQGLGLGGLQGVNAAALQAQLGLVNAAAARNNMLARNHMMGGGVGGDASNRSGGRLSRRTTDPAAEAERKAQQEKLYALDLEKIARGEDRRTTLMIKNIPNKYTQKMLLATVDEYFRGTYDFFYLPIDFKNKCNVGYAFINMVLPVHIIPLVQRFNHKKWERFNSEKVCNISYARIQGRAALVQHFQNSSLMHEDKRCRPILFTLDDSGDIAGEQEPFPSAGGGSGMGSHSNSGAKLSALAGSSNSLRSNGGSSNSLREREQGTVHGAGAGGSSGGAGAAGPSSQGVAARR